MNRKARFEKWERHASKGPNGRVMVYLPHSWCCVELLKLRTLLGAIRGRAWSYVEMRGNDLVITWPTGSMTLYGLEHVSRGKWQRPEEEQRVAA